MASSPGRWGSAQLRQLGSRDELGAVCHLGAVPKCGLGVGHDFGEKSVTAEEGPEHGWGPSEGGAAHWEEGGEGLQSAGQALFCLGSLLCSGEQRRPLA